MLRKIRGFTIVELVIIITVLGVLSTVGIVAWNGVIASSRDRAREADIKQWVSTFDLYKSRFIVWPTLPSNDLTPKVICLGKPTSGGNPKVFLNKCVQYNSVGVEFNGLIGTYGSTTSADYTAFTTEVAKVGNLQENNGPTVKDLQFAGPFAFIWQSTSGSAVTVNAHFISFFETACPSGYTRIATSPFVPPTASPAPPTIPYTALFTGNVIPSNVYACYVSKSFTYSAS